MLFFFVAEFVLCVLVVYVQALGFYFRRVVLTDLIPPAVMVAVLAATMLVCATCRQTSEKVGTGRHSPAQAQ